MEERNHQIEQLRTENSSLARECSEIKDTFERCQRELESLRLELMQQSQQQQFLQDTFVERESMIRTKDNERTRVRQMEDDVIELRAMNEHLESKHAKAKNKIAVLEEQNEVLYQKNGKLKGKLEKAHRKLDRVAIRTEELTEEVTLRMKKKVAEAEAEMERLNKRLREEVP